MQESPIKNIDFLLFQVNHMGSDESHTFSFCYHTCIVVLVSKPLFLITMYQDYVYFYKQLIGKELKLFQSHI